MVEGSTSFVICGLPEAAVGRAAVVVDVAETLDDFVASARETKGSWWPDWVAWLRGHSAQTVAASGGRVPGGGALPAIEAAPGSYVKRR